MPENDKPGKGTRIDGAIDARQTSRHNTRYWQTLRPVESRLTTGQVTDEDIVNWKARFRERSGFHQATVGTIGTLQNSLQLRLGNRYRISSAAIPDNEVSTHFSSLLRFVADARLEILHDARLEQNYRDAYDEFAFRLAGLQSMYSVVIAPPSEASWIMDEPTQHYFLQNTSKLPKLVQSRMGTSSFWRYYERNGSEKGLTGRLSYQLQFVPENTASAVCTVLSQGYYLTRFFPAITEDDATLDVIGTGAQILQRAAQDLENERQRFAGIGIQLNPLRDIPVAQQPEAQEIWQELLTYRV